MPSAKKVLEVVQKARVLLHAPAAEPPHLIALLTHARNSRVCFRTATTQRSDAVSARHKAFMVDKNLCYDGLTKPLKQSFWTSYAAPTVKDRGRKRYTSSKCYAGGSGKEHGTHVHLGLQQLIMAVRAPPKNGPKKETGGGLANVDPCAYWILHTLVKRRIVPVFSEFIIFDECTGLATPIDIIGWDVDAEQIVGIEIKTGHTSQFNYASILGKAHFRDPMQHIPDSALNRAVTQLMLSMLIVARRYGIQVDRGLVLRPMSGKNMVQVYEMPPWALEPDNQQNMYSVLRNLVTSGANARRLMKRTGYGARQRTAIGRQEVQQTVHESSADPYEDVFWTPTELPLREPAQRAESPPPQPMPTPKPRVYIPLGPPAKPSSISTTATRHSGLMCQSDLSWRTEVTRARI